MVPGDDAGAAQLAVHAERAHFALQGITQLLARLQVPDEVGAGVVSLKPGADGWQGQRRERREKDDGTSVAEEERERLKRASK